MYPFCFTDVPGLAFSVGNIRYLTCPDQDPASEMCEHPYLIYIVNDTDVRLSDRYRRPLGLDHKLAQRLHTSFCSVVGVYFIKIGGWAR
jgi:hypothetical protein